MPPRRIECSAVCLLERIRRNFLYLAAFALLGVLLIRPIWSVTYLPLSDLSDHAAQLRAITDYADYRASCSVNWFTPYLFGYAGTLLLSTALPLSIAIKLTLCAAVLAVPNSGEFNGTLHEGRHYDYFLSRSTKPKDHPFREARGSVVLLMQQGAWPLYGRRRAMLPSYNH